LVRLWDVDRPVPRWIPTEVLRAYARSAGGRDLVAAIDAAMAQVVRPEGDRA
jgi:hypothetical protein